MRFLAVACLFLASLPLATAQFSHEETIVRTAYAKFAYAVEQQAIGRLAMEQNSQGGLKTPAEIAGMSPTQRLANAQIEFTLSDFVIGDVHDIMNRKAFDLITPAEGEKLDVSGSDWDYTDEGLATHLKAYTLRWKPARATPEAARNLTLVQLYELNWQKQWPETLWQRYASYLVKVTYQGITRGPYKALFLFGHDEKGDEQIVPQDGTVNAAALGMVLTFKLFPDAFVVTRLRNLPVVHDWVTANESLDASCTIGKEDVCCDLSKLKCGLGHEDVSMSLSKPLPIQQKEAANVGK